MKKFQNKPLTVVAAVSFVIILLIAFESLTNRTTLGLHSILQVPAQIASAVFGTGFELLHFKSIANENKRLKRDVAALGSRAAALDEAVSENRRLKGLLSMKDKIGRRSVAAKVTGLDISNWAESLIINKGIKDGIKEDMAALADGVVIGKVTAVGRVSSRVSLVSDPEIRVAVVSQRGRAGGLMYGIAHGRCIMKFIPKDADIKAGDTVVISGTSGVYPQGFLVGKVIDVKMEFNMMYQFAVIEPAINPMAVEEVLTVE
ncbi:MAG: rod shape-determining protein MreC [Candidatus Omnitrophica bacterium]|nr:rod shape-determining protein MreC [Candidatus Omnitrophota bacterium]MDD5310423.1 rod shape-determining protein MreC [Candidatus Omnitrophota bacterium]MDD5546733.1 rod shape-determining protein MreC [Candidatus Omnitrophota bacterium]